MKKLIVLLMLAINCNCFSSNTDKRTILCHLENGDIRIYTDIPIDNLSIVLPPRLIITKWVWTSDKSIIKKMKKYVVFFQELNPDIEIDKKDALNYVINEYYNKSQKNCSFEISKNSLPYMKENSKRIGVYKGE